MAFRKVGTGVLWLLLAASSLLMIRFLPNWLYAFPTALLVVAVVAVIRGRSIGFAVGLAGLFVMFLLAVATIVGDPEQPTLAYLSLPRYAWLLIACAAFLGLAWILKRAQLQPDSRQTPGLQS
jgi:hypothetical protein